ncbi:MAG: putative ABC transport system ATP-binding protein [Granulosicoccus sp.]|jgi:putative ABC transport system ATP-binding protein
MESTFNRYIWKHTSRQQLWIMCVVLVSMVPFYFAFDLPKMLINGPIQGGGFEEAGATQPFLPGIFGDIQLDRIDTLLGLSMMFLGLVIINGLFKYYINTYKGLLGERLLRRIRYELLDRILRFLPVEFRRIKGGEIASMVKDEVEPLGGFTAEAYVQPLLLGGQAITALIFIVVQNVWLGLLALFMAGIQLVLIPRLRARLLILGRERQISARQLAGRVTEIVEGIETVHAFDTSNYERADIAHRLATLFRIRFQIYSWKYKIKFLNNFLAQITPFLFYLLGGYLAINGSLDVGQLVAVIAAYKELPGPLKALIDWDLAKQDVEVKYEQLLEQFDVAELIDSDSQAVTTHNELKPISELAATNVTVEDHGGAVTLENVSLSVLAGESLAILGDASSGANILAEVFGGITRPAQGKLLAGKENLSSLPESVTGRKITYVSADTYFFYGTVQQNLLYGLKHIPLEPVEYTGAEAITRNWELAEAKRTANPVLDLNSNWIDHDQVTGLTADSSFVDAMRKVLRAVNFSDDVFDFALHSKISSQIDPGFANQIISLRASIQEELKLNGLSGLIIPFDVDCFNGQATVLENILFGILTDPEDSTRYAGVNTYLHNMLKETGLDAHLFSMGMSIAEIFNELFVDLPEDHPHFDQFDLIESSQMPMYRELHQRCIGKELYSISAADRMAWINLSFKYSEPRYRFGLLDDGLMQKIVEIRKLLHKKMPEDLKLGIEIYDSNNFLSSANMLDNIVFGKVDRKIKNGEQKLRDVVAPLLDQQPELYNNLYSIGLEFNVGPSGRRLSAVQRQKLNLARALMRRSDFYVLNKPISGLDQQQQGSIIENTLALFKSENRAPGIIWALASESNAKYFQRIIKFKGKQISKENELSDVE